MASTVRPRPLLRARRSRTPTYTNSDLMATATRTVTTKDVISLLDFLRASLPGYQLSLWNRSECSIRLAGPAPVTADKSIRLHFHIWNPAVPEEDYRADAVGRPLGCCSGQLRVVLIARNGAPVWTRAEAAAVVAGLASLGCFRLPMKKFPARDLAHN